MRLGSLQKRPVLWGSRRFGAKDESRTHLYTAGAQRQRRVDPCPVHDAAGGDHRQAQMGRQNSQQRKQAQLVIFPRGIVEYAAMADQRVTRLCDADAITPYFSILLIHGQGRRP